MLDNNGFNLWADGYIPSVVESDEEGSYPFAGYRQILNEIYNRILASKGKAVLDIGFGPGTLAAKNFERIVLANTVNCATKADFLHTIKI